MQPTHRGLRITLLAGVSLVALAALSPTASAADIASPPVLKKAPSPPPLPPSTWTWWLEGGAFNTGGGSVGQFPSIKPNWGGEGAVGFDWQAQPLWHVNGQFRYGSATKSGPTNSVFQSGTTVITNTGTQHLREDHWLVDFGIGRDFGLGNGNAEWTLGVRVADLRSKLSANGNFVAAGIGGSTAGVFSSQQKSTFVGAGPRFGLQGDIPLGGSWSIDWLAGAAVLFGERNVQLISSQSGGASVSDSPAIFNADAEAGLSYWVNPNLKITASYRYDEYFRALKTLSVASTNLPPTGPVFVSSNIDRSYSGPMLRLTSKF